jgi:hypothetical protein
METENKDLKNIPYFLLQVISGLIGKFKINSYDDLEFIKKKKEDLSAELKAFGEIVGQDQTKANELWPSESCLSKDSFAWMSKDQFKAAIIGINLPVDDVQVLEFWVIK